jgi:hypothetical protein
MSMQCIEGTIKPFEIELPLTWFQSGPSEFANPRPCQTQFGHLAGVFFPDVFWPMFGIITRTKRAFHG